VSSSVGFQSCLRARSLKQVQASSTYTEPLTGQPLSDEETSHVVDNVALRTTIKTFLKCLAAGVKVGPLCDWLACDAGAPGVATVRSKVGR
jgi:hypothetical protein